MELCLVSALAKDIHGGPVESAFLMLVEPASQVATMGVYCPPERCKQSMKAAMQQR